MARPSNNPINERSLLTTAEAAVRLGLSVKTLQNWRCFGTGPRFLKFGAGAVRYSVRELDRWIEANLVASTSAASERR